MQPKNSEILFKEDHLILRVPEKIADKLNNMFEKDLQNVHDFVLNFPDFFPRNGKVLSKKSGMYILRGISETIFSKIVETPLAFSVIFDNLSSELVEFGYF